MSLLRFAQAILAALASVVASRVVLAAPQSASPSSFPVPVDPGAPRASGLPLCPPYSTPAYPPLPDYRTLPRSALPRLLLHRPDQPIPFGYEVKTKPRWGLVIAGAVTFGATYLPTALVGGAIASGPEGGNFGKMLIIPFAGPFASLGFERGRGAIGVLSVINGVMQIGGAGLFVTGYLSEESYLEQTAGNTFKRLRPSLLVGPQSVVLRWQL